MKTEQVANRRCPKCNFVNFLQPLSPAEKTTLEMLLDGFSKIEIAEILSRSPKTISTYWTRIKNKIGAKNLRAVHRQWVERRLLEVPEMEVTAEYRSGYEQALKDTLSPDLNVFNGEWN